MISLARAVVLATAFYVAPGGLANEGQTHLAIDDVSSAIQLAQRSSTPVGIIVSMEDLCTDIGTSHVEPESAQEAFATLQKQLGGSQTIENGVLVIRLGAPPERLMSALSHRFTVFPAMKETIPVLGAVLNGWMRSTIPGNKGYFFDMPESAGDVHWNLQKSQDQSVAQIANKIVQLGNKGFWLAVDSQNPRSDPEEQMQIATFPYPAGPLSNNVDCPQIAAAP